MVQPGIIVLALVILVVGAGVALYAGYLIGASRNKQEFSERLRVEKETSEQRLMELQLQQHEALHEAREETARFRAALEHDNAERRAELQRQERRLQQKEETLERKIDGLEQRERKFSGRERALEQAREEVDAIKREHLKELERIARMTEDQAKEVLLERIESRVREEAARRIRAIEEQAREEADARAREIITLAIQRCASDQVAEAVVSVVPLPNDEMKGRIIGREGRNIRALEAATGIDLIIDDTPEAVILSGFDPVRREVARLALTRLIIDGRIHPARIEDVVAKATVEPAKVIGRVPGLGTLQVGAPADVAIFDLVDGPVEFVDTRNHKRSGTRKLVPALTVRGGRPFGRPPLPIPFLY